jgi:hypothetical protein
LSSLRAGPTASCMMRPHVRTIGSRPGSNSPIRSTRRELCLLLLSLLLVARFAAHALFVPAFEGPDETFHLARVVDFADHPLLEALKGGEIDGAVLAGVRARPCAQGKRDCPPFGTEPASFNLLHPLPIVGRLPTGRNPEANQPPLFYLGAGLLLRTARLADWQILGAPEPRLLLVRLLCVSLFGVGLIFLFRSDAFRQSRVLAAYSLIALTLPGASESLARCANDASVFLWSCLVVWAIDRRLPTFCLAVLLALGPLLKLTALPVCAFAVVALWSKGRIRGAGWGALSSLLVFPLQWVRGWKWGGTYELNRPLPALHESLSSVAIGLIRSAYTFVKTTFWLGGWSFVRAPRALVAGFALLILFTMLLLLRRRPANRPAAHLAGLGLAAAGFLLFAFANRSFFGGWGGVGGWYVWSWFPWLTIAARDVLILRKGASVWVLMASGAFAIAANIVYYAALHRLYG